MKLWLVLVSFIYFVPFFESSAQGSFVPVHSPFETHTISTMIKDNFNHLYVAVDNKGVFKSTDNGESWVYKSTGLLTYLFKVFAVSSNNTLYAGIDKFIYSSTDNGNHWQLTITASSTVNTIRILPNDVILVGTDNHGIYRSVNNGISWTIAIGLTEKNVKKIVNNGSYCFAVTGSKGIFRSSNSGNNWTACNSGLIDSLHTTVPFASVAVKLNGTLVLKTSDKFFRSTNSGDSWTLMNDFPMLYSGEIIFDSSGRLFANRTPGSSYTGLLISTNDGLSWSNYMLPSSRINHLITYGDDLYCSTLGLYKVRDSVVQKIFNKPAGDVYNVYCGPNKTLFAHDYLNNSSLFLSTNFGEDWVKPLSAGSFHHLFISPNGSIFACGDQLHRSDDNGKSWKTLSFANPGIIAFDSLNNVYLGGFVGASLYKSTNNGETWQLVRNFSAGWTYDYVISLFLINNSTMHLVATYYYPSRDYWSKTFYTTDYGVSWEELQNSAYGHMFFDDNKNIIGINFPAGLGISFDKGRTWNAFPNLPSNVYDYTQNSLFDLFISDGESVYKKPHGQQSWIKPDEIPRNYSSLQTYKDSLLFAVADGIIYKRNQDFISAVNDINYPLAYSLSQNYPNPFNPSTSIRFTISKTSATRLTVYDMLGKEIAVLINEEKSPGEYTVQFDSQKYKLSSGVYFYRLSSGEQTKVRKMLLLK